MTSAAPSALPSTAKFGHEIGGFPICKCPANKVNTSEWCDLVRHKPSKEVLAALKARNMTLQDIDDAKGGDVNIDYYPVTITKLPNGPDGTPMTPEQILEAVREDPSKRVAYDISAFNPYAPADAATWTSADPTGAVITIPMGTLPWVPANRWTVPDDGSVVASEVTNRRWIFTTIYTPRDWAHPVSGNREFGFTDFGGDHTNVVFYTRGVDRLTGRTDAALNTVTGFLGGIGHGDWSQGVPFRTADKLWKSYQQGIYDFVKKNGGEATIGAPKSQRIDYKTLKALCAAFN